MMTILRRCNKMTEREEKANAMMQEIAKEIKEK